jgi:methyl-accepting chemotaxis protein
MGQDKYTKFILTVIAFSLFWIALNLSVIEFVLYGFYNEEMKKIFLGISNQTTEVSLRINEFISHVSEISSRIEEISSRADDVVEAIKKR